MGDAVCHATYYWRSQMKAMNGDIYVSGFLIMSDLGDYYLNHFPQFKAYIKLTNINILFNHI